MLLSCTCKIEISLLMAVFLVLVLSFPRRVIGFSFEVVSILDISDDLVKKVFMFNAVISHISILLFHVASLDMKETGKSSIYE